MMGTQQPPLPQPDALNPGTILQQRYRIQSYIGGGGFGYIYQARDLELGHRRAVKEAFCRDDGAREQFRLEGEFLLNVHHPNLVRGYALFEERGRLYLVMDYVDGQTLEDVAIAHIRSTGLPVPEAQILEWMIPICEAVDTLHAQPFPIIHRDIKPANIKLSASQDIPILIDLGLAKLHSNGSQTLAAALAFTPGYAPPEQYQANGSTDERTDVYGLGASLFFLLTGYQPTEAPARLSGQELPHPRALNAALSAQADALVLKAMALNPNERYQSSLELAEALHDARYALGDVAEVTVQAEPASVSTHLALQLCGHCQAANPRGARYCMGCGQSLNDSISTPRPVRALAGTVQRSGVTPRSLRSSARWQRVSGPRARVRPMRPPTAVALASVPGAGSSFPGFGDGAPEREAWASIFALIAAVCAALSIAAAFVSGLLVILFLVPALILGHWSFAQHDDTSPREFRGLALAALVLSYIWLAVCAFAWLALHR